jgi:thioredoxin-like negative regulator of GroEL
MLHEIESQEDFDVFLKTHSAVIVFFSTNDCGICTHLKPKLESMCKFFFPKIFPLHAGIAKNPGIAAKCQIFTAPVVLVFFEGKEFIRKRGCFSISELKSDIERIYKLIFRV